MAKVQDPAPARVIMSPPIEHRDSLKNLHSKAIFRRALETLVPPPCASADLLAAFDNRASYHAIQSWRFGKAIAPQWAVDLLGDKLEKRAAPILALANETRAIRGATRSAGALNLARWNARKKESRNDAAL